MNVCVPSIEFPLCVFVRLFSGSSVFVCIFFMSFFACVFAGKPWASVLLCVCVLWSVNVCVRLSCHVALCVGVSVHLSPLTHTPPLHGPRWLRWVSTHGVHGLDHPGCRGDVGRLLLQAVGLFVDRLYLDVWFTEGDTSTTWKENTTSGHILGEDKLLMFFKRKQQKQQQHFILFDVFSSDLSRPFFVLFLWFFFSIHREGTRCQKIVHSFGINIFLEVARVENEISIVADLPVRRFYVVDDYFF